MVIDPTSLRHVVIAVDSFKGTLSSAEVARICSDAIGAAAPLCRVDSFCIGDGGEGTLDALLASNKNLISRHLTVVGPLGSAVDARYAVDPVRKVADIEIAQACGLTLVPADRRNPMITSSYGVGQLIADALDSGCRRINIFIGGSATNDGGMGMLMALGFKFFDADGRLIEGIGCGTDMCRVAHIDSVDAHPAIADTEFVVACDVDAPLCGPDGAAAVFARQKGADDEMIATLDHGLASYGEALRCAAHRDVTNLPGAGAAGGIGAALMAMLDARRCRGIDAILDAVDFGSHIASADLIITGEGRMDRQTLMGKAPMGVLEAARGLGIPVVAFCGQVTDRDLLIHAGFTDIISITPPSTPQSLILDPTHTAARLKSVLHTFLND